MDIDGHTFENKYIFVPVCLVYFVTGEVGKGRTSAVCECSFMVTKYVIKKEKKLIVA